MNTRFLLKSFLSVPTVALMIGCLGAAHNAHGSGTNVFLVKNTLVGNVLSGKVGTIQSAEIATRLGATNANEVVAISVRDFDDLPTGLRPVIAVVLFNRATSSILETLIEFDLGASGNVPLYGGSRLVTAQAKGIAGGGLVDANVDAVITFTRAAVGPTKLTLTPVGAVTYNDGTDRQIVLQGGQLKATGAPIVITP
jgi:hypothetical protein